MCRRRGGELVWLGGRGRVDSLVKRFTWWDWGIKGNYVWCLVIVVIFRTWRRKEEGGDVLNASFGVASHKAGNSYYGRRRVLTI